MVQETLEERGEVYGDYKGGLEFRNDVLAVIRERYKQVNNVDMPQEQEMWFMDIVGKMSRLAVSPDHIDSWHDLAGYALLVEGVVDDK